MSAFKKAALLRRKARTLEQQGHSAVLVKEHGCPLKAKPHACANCAHPNWTEAYEAGP